MHEYITVYLIPEWDRSSQASTKISISVKGARPDRENYNFVKKNCNFIFIIFRTIILTT